MAGEARVSDRDGDQDRAGAAAAPRSDIAAPRVTETRDPAAGAERAAEAPRAEPHEAQRTGDARSAPVLGRNPEVEESPLPPHEPGSMDIAEHEQTYQGFIRWTIRAVLAVLAVLIFLALFNA